jgi:thioredoxin reductase (NADPH)
MVTFLESSALPIAVIGAGPVGLFAIFQAGMLGFSSLVFDAQPMAGGQCSALYPDKPIYDIPGYPRVTGQELTDQLLLQAAPFSPVYHWSTSIVDVVPIDGGWRLTDSRGGIHEVAAVLLAGGNGAFGPNRPPLASIESYEQRSVWYHVPDQSRFAGKRLMIAGGGDSAVDWAVALAPVANHIYMIHRRPKFRAQPGMVERLHREVEAGRVSLVIPYQLEALEGEDGQLSAVHAVDFEGQSRRFEVDALLAFFGIQADIGPLEAWGLTLDKHRVVVDSATLSTNLPGIYAIGDMASYPHKLKLILTGFAEAAAACHAMYRHIFPDSPLHVEHSTTRGVPGAAVTTEG